MSFTSNFTYLIVLFFVAICGSFSRHQIRHPREGFVPHFIDRGLFDKCVNPKQMVHEIIVAVNVTSNQSAKPKVVPEFGSRVTQFVKLIIKN